MRQTETTSPFDDELASTGQNSFCQYRALQKGLGQTVQQTGRQLISGW